MTNTVEITQSRLQDLMRDSYELGQAHAREQRDIAADVDDLFAAKTVKATSRQPGVAQLVGIQFGGVGQLYTYRWAGQPGDDLALGDKVFCVTTNSDRAKGRVVALYSSDLLFSNIVIKDVVGRRND